MTSSIPFTTKKISEKKPAQGIDKIKEKVYIPKRNSRSFVAKGLLSLRRRLRVFLKSLPIFGERDLVMKTNQRNFHGQILAVLATVLTALVITACGGGGGSSGTIINPATGAVTKAVSCIIQVNAASCNASVEYTTSGATAPKLVVGTTTMATQASGTVPVTIGNVTVPVTLYDDATVLDSSKSLTGSCTSGTSWNGSTCAPVVATWWPPKNIAPVGTKVFGANQVPANATLFTDAAWKQAVVDGTVKFIDTGMTLTGFSTRKVIFAFYKSPKGYACSTIVYADDGSGVMAPLTDLTCNTDSDVEWAVGTQKGIIRYATSLKKCYEKSFDSATQYVVDNVVPCP